MTAVIKKRDVIEGSSVRLTADGYEADRVFLVDGVTGPAHAMEYLALTVPGLPQWGEPHPSIPDAFVNAIVPTSKGGGSFSIRVGYAPRKSSSDPAQTTIMVGTTCQQETVYQDVNGVLLTVTGPDPDDADVTKTQAGTMSVFRPQTTLQFRRTEEESPGDKSILYSGKVNSTKWTVHPNSQPGQWLCMGIVGVSSDNGATYEVTYDFVFKDTVPTKDWRGVIVYMDTTTGRPAAGVSLSNGGIKYAAAYLGINFNLLGLKRPERRR